MEIQSDDAFVYGYFAGALSVAVIAPLLAIAAIRYIPPVRRAVRSTIENLIDTKLAEVIRTELPPDIIGISDAAIRLRFGMPIGLFLHQNVSVQAANAVLEYLGAKETP